MAIEGAPFKKARDLMQKRVRRNREESNRGGEISRGEGTISGRIAERGWGLGNNDSNVGEGKFGEELRGNTGGGKNYIRMYLKKEVIIVEVIR